MNIIGISAYFHDSAACLIRNGEIIAAAQEERFSRKKHDSSFPSSAIDYCLLEGSLKPEEIDFIVFYEKPFQKFERLFETYLAFAPKGFSSFSTALPLWSKEKLFQKSAIVKNLERMYGNSINWAEIILFSEHHLSHAASAFFPSPFDRAAILTMDAVGEWATTSLAIGSGNSLKLIKEIRFPHSLGLLYSAFTYYTGFKVNSGEYKMMGLAPYGSPKFSQLILDHLVDVKDDGSFILNMDYFNYCTGLTMTNKRFHKLFGGKPRKPDSPITQRDMDIAASIQDVVENIVLKLARNIKRTTGEKNLCLAGGVALNCVINGKLLSEKIFDSIWIQPAAGDAGGALGAALAAYYLMLNNSRSVAKDLDSMKGAYLGPSYSQFEINKRLENCGAIYEELSENELITNAAEALSNGAAIGWVNGRMEFGPRSLGNRSIIADPRSPTMQKNLNLKIKFRESFRPFAPSVIRENLSEYFEIDIDSPYMLMVANVVQNLRYDLPLNYSDYFGINKLNVPRSTIPAVTHVDYSARIQTVHNKTNKKFYMLIKKFEEMTGCPVLVNTSFNVRGEPIVCTPEDAFRCFMGTQLDILIVGNSILYKKDQNRKLLQDYKDKYELD
jgi:carbamoyltransferase